MTFVSNLNQSEVKAPTLDALKKLFSILQKRGIRYCHWKSNIRLAESLQGKTDLDLLVDRKYSRIFRQILSEQNIKPLIAAPGWNYPAMENYLGFDEDTGTFFHLHVHYQLVLGERYVKNHRLPFEVDFLTHVQSSSGVNVPLPEFEIIVLAIRVLLKYRTRDLIKDITPYPRPGLNTEFRQEIQWLMAQTSIEKIEGALSSWSNLISYRELLEILKVSESNRKTGFKLQQLKNRVKRRLGLFQRSSAFFATLTYFREMWARRKKLRFSPVSKMTFPEGGRSIAIIGADGAGKSTLNKLVTRWLAGKLDVHAYYIGSNQTSRLSDFYYLVYRAFRRGQRTVAGWVGENNSLSRSLAGLRDIWLALHHLSNARERFRRYVEGGKKVLSGSIVIYDRYPLSSFLHRDYFLMDGPNIPFVVQERPGWIVNSMIRREQAIYDRILPPDILIVLDVSPEVSLQRKADHKEEAIAERTRSIRDLVETLKAAGSSYLVRINADLPLDEVATRIKREIWELL